MNIETALLQTVEIQLLDLELASDNHAHPHDIEQAMTKIHALVDFMRHPHIELSETTLHRVREIERRTLELIGNANTVALSGEKVQHG
jgi:hypothetical protein